ncbi:MAG: hypothetical protein HY754_15790 [Nitrospirae bacterium]|nr:hypothetical protein [Nitrospirota bacterium]
MAKKRWNEETTEEMGKTEDIVSPSETDQRRGGGTPPTKSYRYVGKTIKHFEHDGKTFQLMPNSVYLNLPQDAEQVKRLIEGKELMEA